MKKLIFALLIPLCINAQNTIGLPDVLNYNKFTYNGGLQNWDIRQDHNGILFFANNEGLISFDGSYWNVYPLPNKTIVRSLEITPDKKIYVGGQDEIGYFAANNSGKLQFHSLIPLIPEKDRSFGDIWDIVYHKNIVFFRTNSKIFKLEENRIVTFNAPLEWHFLGISNEILYAQDSKKGLLYWKDNSWQPVFAKNDLEATTIITAILPSIDGNSMVTTLKNGLFNLTPTALLPLATSNNTVFKNDRIYNATSIHKNTIALATSNNGIYIIDIAGNIIQSFSKTEGLQNKNVLSVFTDKQQNLWLGLDNGIDFIAYNSAIKHINPLMQDAAGYTALIHENKLYIGTSNSLCNTPLQNEKDLSFSKGSFTVVDNTKGQAWNLSQINNRLLLGHHEGAFIITNNTATQFSAINGFWNFLSVPNISATANLVSGTYKGISFFNFGNTSLQPISSIDNFTESSRYIAMDKDNTIWVSHPYHGVFKIEKTGDGSYKSFGYTDKNGLPSILNNHIFKLKNEVVVATVKGIYTYNKLKDVMEPAAMYSKLFGDKSLRYVKEDFTGNIWFVSDKKLGVLDVSKATPTVVYFPELTNKLLSGFEFIYPVNENNIFIGGAKGLYHINYEKYKRLVPDLSIVIRSVNIKNINDSLLFGGYAIDAIANKNGIASINNNWKLIRFEFAAPVYGYQNNIEYSYRLKGFDKNWSDWNKRTEKEYTNLPPGTYTFEVRARNNLGNESISATYSFTILPPWYQSTIAFIVYLLLFGFLIYQLIKWQKKKFAAQQKKYEEEQNKLLYILELERNKKEGEIVALQNEKLEADINFQNTELATSAMHLVKKGELLSKIKSELAQVTKGIENNQVKLEIKKITKALNEDDNMDKEWEHFAIHFDKVHSDFLVALKEKHSTITPNELKLSAYLRMNLSTKEIAQLMNISVRGVEISRYRLRKKLAIPTEMSLFDYLIKI
jgi:DNA-binding CsgD family transcriptional regulator